MTLLALKISAASSVAGQIQPGTVQVRSAKVVVPSTIGLVINAVGTQGPPGVGALWRGLWSSGTTYALGDGVTASDGHNYVSLTAGNLNHTPVGDLGVHWADLIPSSVPSMTLPDTGALAAARIAVAHEAPLNVEWPEYGALPGGTQTANTTAINAAITALPANGGEIVFPSRYHTNAPIVMDGRKNILLRGFGGSWNNFLTGIAYHGTGTAVSIKGTGGSTDGNQLVNLSVSDEANTAAILVDLGTSSGTPTAAGSSNCKLDGVFLYGGASGTAILLNLAQADVCHATDCTFIGGNTAIQGVTTTNGFANTHDIEASFFQSQIVIPVKNPGQNWSLIGNVFEPLASGQAGAILHDGTVQSNRSIAGSENLTLLGNSFQDATGGTWCTLRGIGLTLLGNMFDSPAANHVVFPAAVIGTTILGNTFAGATTRAVDNSAGGTSSTAFFMMGNRFISNAVNFAGVPGAGSMYTEPSLVGQVLLGFTFITNGPLDVNTVGKGLQVAEGSNAKQGISSAMTTGAVTVANTSITASSRIILTRQEGGTNPGAVYVSARSVGTSFAITSTNAADTGTVAYQIFEPG